MARLPRLPIPARRHWPALGLLAAAAAVLAPAGPPATAQPAGELTPELRYVPPDSAVFVHLDAARLWASEPARAIRAADARTIDELIGQGKTLFGATPDQLKSVTLFFPKLKEPRDTERFGVVFAFAKPYDKEKLRAGVEKVLPRGRAQSALLTPSDTLAVWLVGLGEEYSNPRAAGNTGPLAAVLREAASGKHLLAAGSTLASLPDEIRGDDLPAGIKPFQPLLKAESVTGTLTLGKDVTLDVRVKAIGPAQAVEAEKAVGLLGKLIDDGLADAARLVERESGADPRANLKDLAGIIKAARGGVKDAAYSTAGSETRVTVKVPADLPFAGAYLGAVVKVREAADRAKSANNLKQIALAMHNYASVYGDAFPPAAVCDRRGKPMLSWRVLILPFVEQDQLYKQFKLDEPWDSEHNKKLLAKMPNVYALPGKTKPGDTTTHYRVFVGNGAAFDYVKGTRFQEITDGTSNTIMAVTAAEAVPWTKPDELDFDQEKDMTRLLGRLLNGQAQAALCDGSVRALGEKISKKTLHAMITKNGGEVFAEDD